MRIRITFSKAGPMQYVGHLDLHKAWERAFRRSGLPLAYSQGFHPQPRLNLACALPLGFTSQCEVLDAWLESEYDLDKVHATLATSLPPGLVIDGVESVPSQAPATQTLVASAVYIISFLYNIPDLNDRVQRVLSAGQLPRQRRDKPYDLRPLIETMAVLPRNDDGYSKLKVQLTAREAATGRPEEVLAELGIHFEDTRVHRLQLIFTI
jgi:radical SAM-linked protein